MYTNKELHLVLGGSGAIGKAVIEELIKRNLSVRAIERSKKVDGIETINIDLMDSKKTQTAITGASYVYLCIGLEYNSKVWLSKWPVIVQNVINACSSTNAKLIFLDHIYMIWGGHIFYNRSPIFIGCRILNADQGHLFPL